MIHFLTQRFIENYDDYKNQNVRQAYGTLCSILSIICNIVLVIFKITIGLIVQLIPDDWHKMKNDPEDW